jgi:hypothetical protein
MLEQNQLYRQKKADAAKVAQQEFDREREDEAGSGVDEEIEDRVLVRGCQKRKKARTSAGRRKIAKTASTVQD